MTLTLMMVSADPAAKLAKPKLIENHTLVSFVEEAPDDPTGQPAVGTGLRWGEQSSAASTASSSRRYAATGSSPAAKTPARYSKTSYAGLNQYGAPPAKLPEALLDYSDTSYQDAPVLPQVPADPAEMDYSQMGGQTGGQTDGQMCCDDGCWMCDPCCMGRGWGHKLHAWKTVWKPDMVPHIPYRALPADYYYFRPYNAMHIPPQQQEVMMYGEDPRDPYANKVFDGIYEGLEDESEAVDVPQPQSQRPVPPKESLEEPALPAAAPAFPPPVPTDTPNSSGSAWVPDPSAAPLSVDNVWVPKGPNTPQRSSAGAWASRASATPSSSATPPLRSALVPQAPNASRHDSGVHVSGASFHMSDSGTYETSGNPLR